MYMHSIPSPLSGQSSISFSPYVCVCTPSPSCYFSLHHRYLFIFFSLSLSPHTHIHIAHLFSLPYIHPYITPIPISHTHAHLLEQCFSLFSSSSVHVPLCAYTPSLSPALTLSLSRSPSCSRFLKIQQENVQANRRFRASAQWAVGRSPKPKGMEEAMHGVDQVRERERERHCVCV